MCDKFFFLKVIFEGLVPSLTVHVKGCFLFIWSNPQMVNLFQFVPISLLLVELHNKTTVCALINILIYDMNTFAGFFDIFHEMSAIRCSADSLSADLIGGWCTHQGFPFNE